MKQSDKHSILIADRHETMLDGLSNVLVQMPSLKLVGVAMNCIELMYMVGRHLPDVCIVNSDLPGADIFQLNQNLLNQGLTTNIVLISDRCENSIRKRISAAGIKACLFNPFDVNELIFAISEVLKGKEYYSGKHYLNSGFLT